MFGHDDQDNAAQGGQTVSPTEPIDDGTLGVPMADSGTPATQTVAPPAGPPHAGSAPFFHAPLDSPIPNSGGTAGDLIGIKQEALQELKPLVGHLDQTPEEKFRTTMMMIQAVDDQSLIPDAYQAAKAILDEKARAQALLDVVNEINYFTTQSGGQG